MYNEQDVKKMVEQKDFTIKLLTDQKKMLEEEVNNLNAAKLHFEFLYSESRSTAMKTDYRNYVLLSASIILNIILFVLTVNQ